MPVRFDDIVQDCVERSGPNVGSVDIAEVLPRVWGCFVRHVAKTLSAGRGVIVPRFAKITFMKTTGRPVFDVADVFLRSYGISMKKPPVALQAVCSDVNFSRIAHDARVEKDFASTVVDTVLRRLGEIIGDGKEAVYAPFGTVGTLFAEGRTMGFRFAREKRQKQRRQAGGGGGGGATFSAKAPASAAGLTLSGAGAAPGLVAAPSQPGPEAEAEREPVAERASSAAVADTGGGGGGDDGDTGAPSGNERGDGRKDAVALQRSHLDMMKQKREAMARTKAVERDEYAQSMRDLRASERVRQAELTKKRLDAVDVANVQREQMRENMEHTLAERDADERRGKEPWPFKTEQQVKDDKMALDSDFRQGLDKQLVSARRRRGDSESVPTALKSKSRVAPIHNVFPRFLEPEREVSRAHFVPPELFNANMRQSWDALHISMQGEERNIAADREEARQRRERAELLHQKQAIERRRERAELNEFLRNQARLKQKLDHDAEHELFYGTDPDPSQAYPVEKKRNIEQEHHIKRKLKNALDLQVAEKQTRKSEERRQQKQEDNFFIDCVQHALRNDRAYRCKKMANDRLMLTTQWEAQKATMAKQRKLVRARDNVAIADTGIKESS